ncbi:hypothetical protein LR48_Vigan511s001900 [Vigna angularis]|uniref:Uncharacterized protein n=1 Tax=Phaseolus angularis TaxID=3914 RepID=A0A0L9TCT3_PHAAN|nr:hypothetical protein LR48_Vigan511s001900 [Vigna angularis]
MRRLHPTTTPHLSLFFSFHLHSRFSSTFSFFFFQPSLPHFPFPLLPFIVGVDSGVEKRRSSGGSGFSSPSQAQWFCSSTASRNYGTRGATSFCRSPPWVTEQLLLTSAAMVTPTPVLCFFLLHSPHHGLHLFGTLSVDIAHLSFLSNLSLADNIFFSPIPPPLSSLSALRFLNLSNNGFNQTEYTQYTTSHTTMEPDSLHGIEYGGLVEKRESNSEHVRDLRQRGTEYS